MEERLQKVLASAGVASRREAEKYILAGRVKVNGKIVKELGTKVGEKAFILVDGKPIKREKKAYYLFYETSRSCYYYDGSAGAQNCC